MAIHWYDDVLKAIRLRGEITSEHLADDLGTTVQIASGWINKMWRWGYIRPQGSTRGARRWVRIYVITAWGRKLKRPDPRKARHPKGGAR